VLGLFSISYGAFPRARCPGELTFSQTPSWILGNPTSKERERMKRDSGRKGKSKKKKRTKKEKGRRDDAPPN